MPLWGDKESTGSNTGTLGIASSGVVTGVGTNFLTELEQDWFIRVNAQEYLIVSITNSTSMLVGGGETVGTIVTQNTGSSFTVSQKPKFLAASDAKTNAKETVFVDLRESAVTRNIPRGFDTAGWVKVLNYTDANGNDRWKTEILVPMKRTFAYAGDAENIYVFNSDITYDDAVFFTKNVNTDAYISTGVPLTNAYPDFVGSEYTFSIRLTIPSGQSEAVTILSLGENPNNGYLVSNEGSGNIQTNIEGIGIVESANNSFPYDEMFNILITADLDAGVAKIYVDEVQIVNYAGLTGSQTINTSAILNLLQGFSTTYDCVYIKAWDTYNNNGEDPLTTPIFQVLPPAANVNSSDLKAGVDSYV